MCLNARTRYLAWFFIIVSLIENSACVGRSTSFGEKWTELLEFQLRADAVHQHDWASVIVVRDGNRASREARTVECLCRQLLSPLYVRSRSTSWVLESWIAQERVTRCFQVLTRS